MKEIIERLEKIIEGEENGLPEGKTQKILLKMNLAATLMMTESIEAMANDINILKDDIEAVKKNLTENPSLIWLLRNKTTKILPTIIGLLTTAIFLVIILTSLIHNEIILIKIPFEVKP